MRPLRFILNRDVVDGVFPPGASVLDVLRRRFHLTGTKEGCREGDCGACMVLVGTLREGWVEYHVANSCLLPVGELAGRHLVTIEGLNTDVGLNPLQEAFVRENASQCGFCTPGFIVALTAFALSSPRLDEDSGVDAVAGNLCRCTGYQSIRRAVAELCRHVAGGSVGTPPPPAQRLPLLIERGIVPAYFHELPERLAALPTPDAGMEPDDREPRVFVGGGTDLFVQRAEALHDAPLEFVAARPDLRGVRVEGSECRVGGATSVEAFLQAEGFRAAVPCADVVRRQVSSLPIRHRATVAGNLVNASPIGDLSVFLLALEARLQLAGATGRRELPLREFFLGYKKLDLRSGERVERVDFVLPSRFEHIHFEKVSRREHLDIASVNTAIRVEVDDGRIRRMSLSAGGVAPVPLLLVGTMAAAVGQRVDSATARRLADLAAAEAKPISDVRGSAEYKRLLLRNLVLAHFAALFPGTVREEDLL